MKRVSMFFCMLLLLPFMFMADNADASNSPKPDWVRTFANGETRVTNDYEGISFCDVTGAKDSHDDYKVAAARALEALASTIKTDVKSEIKERFKQENGYATEDVDIISTTTINVVLRDVPCAFWFDAAAKRLWAKAAFPKNELEKHIPIAPPGPMKKEICHGRILKWNGDIMTIHLEDGRQLNFETEAQIAKGEFVKVYSYGFKFTAVFCNNMQVDGSFCNVR